MLSNLNSKDVLVIFAYSPAGLGHLRVTDALYHGLPDEVTPALLGSQDSLIKFMHRFTSIHPLARWIFESSQQGVLEDIFTQLYRIFLHKKLETTYDQMVTVLEQRVHRPKTVIIIATHFALAHQLAAIKSRLMQEKDIHILLAVQVTDDSPQKLWYVSGADIIFVPSHITMEKLVAYGRQAKLPPVKFVVLPYPVSPLISEYLSPSDYEQKKHQLSPHHNTKIHVCIPISGAAVGTQYYSSLIKALHSQNERFMFHIVTKTAPFTKQFIEELLPHAFAHIETSLHDRVIVNIYEKLYLHQTISLEITKPSEQAFKALIDPRQKGGALLLFSKPIGRQEYDNIHFLQRHKLIPHKSQQEYLWHLAKTNTTLHDKKKDELLASAQMWRGILLPEDPDDAAQCIEWCLNQNVFASMNQFTMYHIQHSENNFKYEIQNNGVELFWAHIQKLLTEKNA